MGTTGAEAMSLLIDGLRWEEVDMSRLSLARDRRRSYSSSEYSELESDLDSEESDDSGSPPGNVPGIMDLRADIRTGNARARLGACGWALDIA